MLEIREKFSAEGYGHIAEKAGDLKFHITEALDGDTAIGYIAYAYDNDKTIVFDYDDGGDLMLCDGLVRSVIFKSCLKNISTVVFELSDKGRYENLRKLRFLSQDSNVSENIDRFMNNCQDCKSK